MPQGDEQRHSGWSRTEIDKKWNSMSAVATCEKRHGWERQLIQDLCQPCDMSRERRCRKHTQWDLQSRRIATRDHLHGSCLEWMLDTRDNLSPSCSRRNVHLLQCRGRLAGRAVNRLLGFGLNSGFLCAYFCQCRGFERLNLGMRTCLSEQNTGKATDLAEHVA